MEEKVAEELAQLEKTVAPPTTALLPTAPAPPDGTLAGNNVNEVAANVAVSTEPETSANPPPPKEIAPKKRARSLKAKTEAAVGTNPVSSVTDPPPPLPSVPPPPPPSPPPLPAPPPPPATESEEPFIPAPIPVIPSPPPKLKIKLEENPSKPSRKRKTPTEAATAKTAPPEIVTTPVTRKEKIKPKQEIDEPPAQIPAEIPGCKINYATTSITTENVLTHKRIKKRPNYALMNDDADDAARRKKTEAMTRSSDATTSEVAKPAPAAPAASVRMSSRRRRAAETPEPETPEAEADDEDDDEFTPKHVSRSKAAKAKQEAEPGQKLLLLCEVYVLFPYPCTVLFCDFG